MKVFDFESLLIVDDITATIDIIKDKSKLVIYEKSK